MAHGLNISVIFLLVITVAGCGIQEKEIQSVKKASQSNEKHDIQISFNFNSGNDQGKHVSGFRLYQDGKLVCETRDPQDRSIQCTVTGPAGTFAFTLTAHFENGSESEHSEPFLYTIPE